VAEKKQKGCFPRLQLIIGFRLLKGTLHHEFHSCDRAFQYAKLNKADGGYAGKLVDWVKTVCHWVLDIVRRPQGVKGFQVLPRRWVVERTFGWLGRYRRLSKDYEELPETSEAMIYAAMIHVMVRRLARQAQPAAA